MKNKDWHKITITIMLRDGHEAVLRGYESTCALLQHIEKEDWVTLLMQKK